MAKKINEETQIMHIDKKTKSNKKKSPKKKLFGNMPKWKVALYITSMVIIVGTLVVGAIGSSYVYSVIKDDKITYNRDKVLMPESTRIFAADGTLISELGVEIRENIEYKDIPQVMIDAILSIEDARFFKHNGFDTPRLFKATLGAFMGGGFDGAGGSTITQQLVKLALFDWIDESSSEKVARKIKELSLAVEMTNDISKEEVLALYLNIVNFGDGAYGIEKASRNYFGKSASELTLPEAAMLAGILNQPATYNPRYNLDKSTRRRNEVLDAMVYHGYITEEEAKAAASVKVENTIVKKPDESDINPFQAYIDVVILEAKEATGLDPVTTPMDIYTYLDKDAQLNINALMRGDHPNIWADFPDDYFEAAISVQETTTGRIVALGGGREYTRNNGVQLHNLAYSEPRQPGSAIKPILDYAPAFDNLGISTAHYFLDAPITSFNWPLNNATGVFNGPVSIQQAFGNSLNTPPANLYIDLANKLGEQEMVNFLHRLGFEPETTVGNWARAYSIGGFTYGATVVQMAAATAAIGNNGEYITPHTVDYIVKGYDGDQIKYVDKDIHRDQVYSPAAAFMTADLMKSTADGNYLGLGALKVPNIPTYVKSGTSEHGEGIPEYGIPRLAMKDRWATGFTADYTVTVWNGYAKLTHDISEPYLNFGVKHDMVNWMFKETLNFMHRNGSVSREITPPSTVKQERVVKGAFPYLIPVEGTPEDSAVTGWFNIDQPLPSKVFAPDPIMDLKEFSVNEKDRLLTISFGSYLPVDMTTPGSDTVTVKNYNGSDLVLPALFDIKKVFGYVQYFVEVVDASTGQVIIGPNAYAHEYHSNITIDGSGIQASEVEVCGYYALSLTPNNRSNKVCQKIKLKDSTPPVINNLNQRQFTVKMNDPAVDIKKLVLEGVTAYDELDGDVTSSLEIIGQVNLSVPGVYRVAIRATDLAGNKTDDNQYQVSVVVKKE